MSERFHRGLVVGKFCPLHFGHELLIRRAAEACDELVVVSYTKPEFERCEPATRAVWLAARFPNVESLVFDDHALRQAAAVRGIDEPPAIPENDAPDVAHREFVGWLCWTLLGKTVDAVFTSEAYGDGFAAGLTQYFRARGSVGSDVRHVCVDSARRLVPISATRVRSDPHAHKRLLADEVYARLVQRVCLLGESTGKSTLAATLAARFATCWAPEYGRELWERQGGKLAFEDLLQIAEVQIEREHERSEHANRWLFCDTSPLTTLLYSRELFGSADPALERLAERAYDAVFVCAPDFPFVQDATRRDGEFRERQHAWYVRELGARHIAFSILEGTIERRAAAVSAAIDAYR